MPMNYPSAGEQAVEDILREGVPEVDSEQAHTDSIPTSYTIYKRNGTIYADAQVDGLPSFEDSDFSTVVQNAIDALPGEGGTVYIKTGTYTVNTTISITSSAINIVGDGWATVLKPNDVTCFKVDSSAGEINLPLFRDIHIDGSGNTTGYGIHFTGSNSILDFSLVRVWIFTTGDHGLYNEVAANSRIYDCDFETCGGSGIENTGGTLRVTHTWCNGNAVGIHTTGKIYATNCTFANNDNYGFHSDTSQSLVVQCNTKGNGDNGFYFSNGYRSLIIASTAIENGKHGIRTAAEADAIVSLNMSINNNQNEVGGAGLALQGTGTVATGNRVIETITPTHNYSIISYKSDMVFEGNVIDGEIYGTVTDFIYNGRYYKPKTIDLGGTNQNIDPVKQPIKTYDLKIDAGGSATTLYGIGTINQEGNTVILYHTGGETITLAHNDTANGTDAMLLKNAGADRTLDANGEMIALEYDAQNSKWREKWVNLV